MFPQNSTIFDESCLSSQSSNCIAIFERSSKISLVEMVKVSYLTRNANSVNH